MNDNQEPEFVDLIVLTAFKAFKKHHKPGDKIANVPRAIAHDLRANKQARVAEPNDMERPPAITPPAPGKRD